MPLFTHKARFDASVEEIWNWYNSPGAFRRIMPEWEGIDPIQAGKLEDGEETIFKVSIGQIKRTWLARHHSVDHGVGFSDRMIKGHSVLGITSIRSKMMEMSLSLMTTWSTNYHSIFSQAGLRHLA